MKKKTKRSKNIILPDIVKLWIRAYSQRLRVRSHGVQFSMGVEFRASNRLHVLERCHRNESRSSAIAISVAGIEFLPRFLLKTRTKSGYELHFILEL